MEEHAYTVVHVSVQEVDRFSDGSVMMWAAISYNRRHLNLFQQSYARLDTERVTMDFRTTCMYCHGPQRHRI